MAGPWEAYQTPAQAAPEGPWTAFQSAPQGQAAQGEEPRPSAFGRAARFVDNVVRQTARGVTMGFADELSAAARTGAGLWGNYGEALAQERARDREFEQSNPIAATAAQVGGGVMLPGGALARGATLGGSVARGAALGAAQGGVTGFGEGQGGFQERVGSATGGAALGAGIGAAVPVALRGGTALAQSVGRATGLSGGAASAERTILRDIGRDGMTAEDVATAAREAGTAPAMIADLAGENVAQTAQAVARAPGAGRQMAGQEIAARAGANQAERVAGRVRDLVSGDDFVTGVEDVARRRAAQAGPAYERAYSVVLDATPRLQRFLDDPDVRRGIAAGIESARREAVTNDAPFNLAALGVRMTDGGVEFTGVGTPTRLIDAAKRGLDELIEASRGEGGRATSRTRELTGLREAMLREVDRLNPAFAQARAQYADQSALIGAARDGRRLLSANVEDFERSAADIARMTPQEREFLRLGLARGMLDRIEGATDAQDLTRLNRIFGTPAIRQRLRAAFDSEDDFRRFAGEMQREIQMARTNANIAPRGGSPTAPMQERLADLRSPPPGPITAATMREGAEPQPNLLREMAGAESFLSGPNVLARRFFRARDDAALQRDMAAMAPYLFTTDPAARQALANRLVARQMADERARRIAAPVVQGIARGGTAGAVLSTE